MRLLYRRCAGLDIHKKSISACIRIRVHNHKVETFTAVFGTFTQELERLGGWLKEHKVKQIAMESTGVYWIPVWNILELSRWRFQALLLVNPQQVRALPGRKTDRVDCQRIAELLQYGLLRGSFIPPRPIRELRDLTRRRVHLQGDRNRIINRIGRLLETANVKLGSVISNIVGASGRAMLHAMVAGKSDPEKLAGYQVGQLKASPEELVLALDGRYNDHFRWLLRELLEQLQDLDRRVMQVDVRLWSAIEPYRSVVERLCTLPGVKFITACTILAEIGADMTAFPDAAHLASWAGLCPGNHESGGKRQSGRTRKGDRYLRRLLIQNSWAIARKKDCYLTALFYRLAARKGEKKAAVAVAHKLLVIAYYIIRDGVQYRDAGGDFFDRRDPERTAKRLARRLERIGYSVLPKAAPIESGRARKHHPITVEQAGGCARCAQWGVPCIHVRPRRSRTAITPKPTPPCT